MLGFTTVMRISKNPDLHCRNFSLQKENELGPRLDKRHIPGVKIVSGKASVASARGAGGSRGTVS